MENCCSNNLDMNRLNGTLIYKRNYRDLGNNIKFQDVELELWWTSNFLQTLELERLNRSENKTSKSTSIEDKKSQNGLITIKSTNNSKIGYIKRPRNLEPTLQPAGNTEPSGNAISSMRQTLCK